MRRLRLPHHLFATTVTKRYNGQVKEPPRETVVRRSDEPTLEMGDTVLVKEGVVGVVLARFVPSRAGPNEVHYIVELRPVDTDNK